MKTDDFMDIIGKMDENYIEAIMQEKPKKSHKGIGALCAAAALTLTIGGYYVGTKALDSEKIVYATEFVASDLLMNTPTKKVEKMTDFAQYDDKLVRVMISIYDIETAYPEIYNKAVDGETAEKLIEEYNAFLESGEKDDVQLLQEKWNKLTAVLDGIYSDLVQEEKEWIESIGGKDIEIKSPFVICCTLKANQLNALETGKCNYRIFLAPKNIEKNTECNIEDYFGDYVCAGLAYMPAQASSLWIKESAGNKLHIDENKVYFGSDDKMFYGMDAPRYSIDTENDRIDKFYGFDLSNFELLNKEMLSVLANDHVIINVNSNEKSYRMIIGESALYFDFGINGIFKFEKE